MFKPLLMTLALLFTVPTAFATPTDSEITMQTDANVTEPTTIGLVETTSTVAPAETVAPVVTTPDSPVPEAPPAVDLVPDPRLVEAEVKLALEVAARAELEAKHAGELAAKETEIETKLAAKYAEQLATKDAEIAAAREEARETAFELALHNAKVMPEHWPDVKALLPGIDPKTEAGKKALDDFLAIRKLRAPLEEPASKLPGAPTRGRYTLGAAMTAEQYQAAKTR